jgi:hypothetical protein
VLLGIEPRPRGRPALPHGIDEGTRQVGGRRAGGLTVEVLPDRRGGERAGQLAGDVLAKGG